MKKVLKFASITILTLSLCYVGFAFNVQQTSVSKIQIPFKKNFNNYKFSHFQTIEVEEREFVIIESEPEFEVELDWFSTPTKSFNILQSSLKEKQNSYLTTFFTLKNTIPLYELYCNWKFHLS